jgi:glycosyltransferase involved in cell wall biosynthesis
MTCEAKLWLNRQKKVCYTINFKQKEKLRSSLKVFAVFFHPAASVTAMGGAEKRFVETLKIFCREDDVEIAVLESAPSFLAKKGIKCEKFLLPLSFHGKGWLSTYLEWILWTVKASFKSFSLVRNAKTDVIFVPNNTLPNLVLGYVTGVIFRRPTCIVVHHIDTPFFESDFEDVSLYKAYRSIKYGKLVSFAKTLAFYITLPLLRRAEAIIAVSNFTAKALKNNGVSGPKIFVSGNAVDLDFISKVEPYYGEKFFQGVFVGRISKEKGIFDLLNVWKDVVKVRKDAKLLIIGSGLELPTFKEKIVASDLENNVFVRGQCSEVELYGLLKSSKIFIFPSIFEGWGIAVAEALACGLPVVAYDIPALREVFGECKSVFLVPAKDVKSMTSAVLKVLNAGEEELDKLSYYSKIYSKQFCWEKIAKKDLEPLRDFGSTHMN